MLKFIRASLLLASFEILLAAYATLVFAQSDPRKVLIGTWEGDIDERKKGSNMRRLIIRSVKPTETGWLVTGRLSQTEDKIGYAIRKGEVTIQDGVIVLEFTSPQNDSYRFVLTENNRLDGTFYYAHKRGGGVGMRTYHLSLEKTSSARSAPKAP
jgi:hypothetical protein